MQKGSEEKFSKKYICQFELIIENIKFLMLLLEQNY